MTEEFQSGQHYPVLTAGEAILWRGKPNRRGFIISKSLTMMPIAIVWLIFDMSAIVSLFSEGEMLFFLIPFFALHLLPVWIWLGSMLSAGKRWKNTNYYVTNRRIIIQGGFFAVNETSLFYKELRSANLRVGLLNKLMHTGTIVFDDRSYANDRDTQRVAFENLEDAPAVYNRIHRIIMDVQTDIEYPNALRPEENPGYHTDYQFE